MKKTSQFQNYTKRRTLEFLEDKSWRDVPTIADEVGIQPVRRAYTYLARLEELRLIARASDGYGKLHYRITERGLERLHWLRSKDKPTITLDGIVAAALR